MAAVKPGRRSKLRLSIRCVSTRLSSLLLLNVEFFIFPSYLFSKMSFGFSVGDFLTLSTLAWDVYSSCKDSSREFKDLAGQVNSLYFILQSTAEHLLNHPPETKEAAELAGITTRCHDSLTEINCLLRRHSSLGTQKPRRWDMLKWAFGDALRAKDRLVFHATVLAALNSSLTQYVYHPVVRLDVEISLTWRAVDFHKRELRRVWIC